MPIDPEFLNEIQSSLESITPNLTMSDDASDVFEAYIFSLVIRAARNEGATVSFQDFFGNTPSTFVFRTSPGYISSRERPYTHAVIEFPGKPELEAHLGIRIEGLSRVLHECDVAVIYKDEADTCRQNPNIHPRHSKVIMAVECKFYSTMINLNLVRSFVGLISDISKEDRFFVVNVPLDTPGSVQTFLSRHAKGWDHNVIPSSNNSLNRLIASFQNVFKNYKARQ